MFSDEIAIAVSHIGKSFAIYDSPSHRLKQFLMPRLRSFFRLKEKKFFREFHALSDISFEVRRGETIGIIGRNGSGKSTLLQIICGTLSPTHGSVQTRGRVAALLELGSGFNPEFSGRENVYMNAALHGLSRAQIDARFSNIIAFADIGEFIDQPVKTYSSGMYVRLAFSIIAHIDADILVIDEALAVGDVFFTQKCMRFLRKFMESGVVLFVSHDTSSILSLCNRAIWLETGGVRQIGSPRDVCESYLADVYGTAESPNLALPEKDKLENWAVNDLKHNGVAFGKGGATIINAELLDEAGNPISSIIGGELINLKVDAHVNFMFESPIIGFFVKDRLGQMLFGENTFLSHDEKGKILKVNDKLFGEFSFRMPLLPAGTYSVTLSIASGTQANHEQQHWIHDALIFTSISDRVCNGLIGVSMLKVDLQVTNA